MTMIEKMAIAIAQSLSDSGVFPADRPASDPWLMGPSLLAACSVLVAIREPTWVMCVGGADAADFVGVEPARRIWQAMVDGALAEKPKPVTTFSHGAGEDSDE